MVDRVSIARTRAWPCDAYSQATFAELTRTCVMHYQRQINVSIDRKRNRIVSAPAASATRLRRESIHIVEDEVIPESIRGQVQLTRDVVR